jgi:hypothetical protein
MQADPTHTCPDCGWTGPERALFAGDYTDQCPSCFSMRVTPIERDEPNFDPTLRTWEDQMAYDTGVPCVGEI